MECQVECVFATSALPKWEKLITHRRLQRTTQRQHFSYSSFLIL